VAAHVQDAIDEVSALLTQTHRGVEDFTFDTRQELAESIENTARSTRLTGGLIAGISLISLIVGGILGLAATLGTPHLIKFTTDSASLPVFQTASVILSFAFAVLIGIYGVGRRFTFTSRGIAHHVRRSLHCPHFLSAGVLRVQLRPSAARRRQTHLRLTPMRPESPNHAL
jgi:ABC-type antimicrobial peptide transport system permease subunit